MNKSIYVNTDEEIPKEDVADLPKRLLCIFGVYYSLKEFTGWKN
jgi:hypothetical protein